MKPTKSTKKFSVNPEVVSKLQQIIKSTPTMGKVEKVEAKNPAPAKSAELFPKLIKGAADIATKVVGSKFPVIGSAAALLKQVLSANDDEWFSEYRPAGATFNEILATEYVRTDADNKNVMTVIPAIMETFTTINEEAVESIMPTVLAYIRTKTNNVLISDDALYTKALVATIRLYMLYYTIKKYEKLANNIPTNIPTISAPTNAISPIIYSQLVGIGTALKAYLQTTTGIPYALAEYLRWRFGTVFYSENTGKPGLIIYNPVQDTAGKYLAWQANQDTEDPAIFIKELDSRIKVLQAEIGKAGRAVSDIHLAYLDHQIRYDVEDAHYDAKEFNLRCNLSRIHDGTIVSRDVPLILDSRLDPSAALQAVTISTLAPYTNEGTIATPGTKGAGSLIEGNNSHCLFPVFGSIIYLLDNSDLPRAVGTNFYTITGTKWRRIEYSQSPDARPYLGDVATVSASASQFRLKGKESISPDYTGNVIYAFATIALQSHYNNLLVEFNCTADQAHQTAQYHLLQLAPLSYDRAVITPSQLDSIQRLAIRNLFRGDYKVKSAKQAEDTKKDMNEIVKTIDPEVVVKPL